MLNLILSKGFVTQKQVKINAGKIELRFGVVMTPFSSSKMIQIHVNIIIHSFKRRKTWNLLFAAFYPSRLLIPSAPQAPG